MKQKELNALKEYRLTFYSVKFQLADVYIAYAQKTINEEEMLKEIHQIWRDMNKKCSELG